MGALLAFRLLLLVGAVAARPLLPAARQLLQQQQQQQRELERLAADAASYLAMAAQSAQLTERQEAELQLAQDLLALGAPVTPEDDDEYYGYYTSYLYGDVDAADFDALEAAMEAADAVPGDYNAAGVTLQAQREAAAAADALDAFIAAPDEAVDDDGLDNGVDSDEDDPFMLEVQRGMQLVDLIVDANADAQQDGASVIVTAVPAHTQTATA